MATVVARALVVVAVGVLVGGEPGVGADGTPAGGGDYLLAPELLGGPEGHPVGRGVAEDVFSAWEEVGARGLAPGEVRLEG